MVQALEDVEKAVHDAAEARELTSVVFRLKELAEFAEKPSITKAVGIARNKESDEEKTIQRGIENLGHYGVDLELASHGFSSVEELNNRAQMSCHHVAEAAVELGHYDGQQELAES